MNFTLKLCFYFHDRMVFICEKLQCFYFFNIFYTNFIFICIKLKKHFVLFIYYKNENITTVFREYCFFLSQNPTRNLQDDERTNQRSVLNQTTCDQQLTSARSIGYYAMKLNR